MHMQWPMQSRMQRTGFRRRRALHALMLAAGLAAGAAQAQQAAARVAVPLYDPGHVAVGLARHWSLPLSAAFDGSAQALAPALQALCEAAPAQAQARLEAARSAWTRAVGDWELYASVPLGALIERRSQREIDFTPTRPELIARAIERGPRNAADMERVGTPAKGLPALEWLLWTRPAAPGAPACGYAVQVAAEVAREAAALHAAAQATARELPEQEAAGAAFGELLNQWVGAVERLRWQQIERPRREAASRGARPAWPRQASGRSAASWAASWQGLRRLAVIGDQGAPAPGEGLVSIEAYLRGRGRLALADRWAERIARTDAAMRALQPARAASLDAAVRELAQTRRLAEDEVATALEVSLGFSDADGD